MKTPFDINEKVKFENEINGIESAYNTIGINPNPVTLADIERFTEELIASRKPKSYQVEYVFDIKTKTWKVLQKDVSNAMR